MRRGVSFAVGVLACLAAGVLAAGVVATPGLSQLPITTGTTGTTTGSTTTRTVEPDLIADGVWIGRVEVGGMTPEGATALVQTEFGESLPLRFGHRTILVTAQRLGATARIKLAIDQARRAAPNTRVPLFVNLRRGGGSRYVKALGRRFDRRGKDAELVGLRNLRPWITKERTGRVLRRRAAVRAIVATGQSQYPTPLGRYSIVTMQRHPWWYPPDSDWAKGEKPIPPGPGNPLGTRWMGLTAPGVGIHGTPDAASIGYSVSHGCIRMRISEAEWLFNHVDIGTTVFIVAA